ncbi:MAG: TerC family protein [Terricaulis sp.]
MSGASCSGPRPAGYALHPQFVSNIPGAFQAPASDVRTEHMDFILSEFAGQPIWLWLSFLGIVGLFLWVDLGLINKRDGVISPAKSAMMWAGFASLAMLFGLYVYYVYEPDAVFYNSPDNLNQQAVIQYFTGYLLETALAFDNIFVISLIFTYFAVPREYQHRVLFWGILGAIVFRALFISAGAAVVNSWTWVLYFFAAFLIWTGWRMLGSGEQHMNLEDNRILKFVRKHMKVTDRIETHNFFVRQTDPKTNRLALFATPLFLALIMVEAADIVFAVDSVPAIFAVTRDPFIVYTSNIFAILGLRSMYFMLAAAVERFAYLKYGLSLVLVLIGVKIIWNFGLSKELGWLPYLEPHWALVGTLGLIGGAILYSLYRTRRVSH